MLGKPPNPRSAREWTPVYCCSVSVSPPDGDLKPQCPFHLFPPTKASPISLQPIPLTFENGCQACSHTHVKFAMLLQVHYLHSPSSPPPRKVLHQLLLWHLHLIRQQLTPHDWWITSPPLLCISSVTFVSWEIRKLSCWCTNKRDPGWLFPFAL